MDTLQSLVAKSLLQHLDRRFWMLETIREYALERLQETGEAGGLRRRHARYFLELARRQDAELRAGEPEEGPVAVLEDEIDNLRVAVDLGLETGEAELVREITATLPMYWIVRGRYVEGRSWLDRALALDDSEDDTRRRLLSGLAYIANKTRRHEQSEALLAENLQFVRSKGQTRCEAHTLAGLAETTLRRGRPQDCAEDALLGATLALQIRDNPTAAYCLDLVATSAAARGDIRSAASILGATAAVREAMGVGPDEDEEAIRAQALELIDGDGVIETAWAKGRAIDLASALELAEAAVHASDDVHPVARQGIRAAEPR